MSTMPTPDRFIDEFKEINRALIWAEDMAAWRPAAQAMHQALENVEATLKRDDFETVWSPAASSKLFSILLTILAEAGQYRHETVSSGSGDQQARYLMLSRELLPGMLAIRIKARDVAVSYLSRPSFKSLAADIQAEIFPLLDSMTKSEEPESDRFMPFRVIQLGNIAERLCSFVYRTSDPYLVGDGQKPGLLTEIYQRKYLRFGTSGVRGRWGRDFTELRAKQVVQAICDFLKNKDVPPYVQGEDLTGKRMVIGYDSRLNARLVAEWAAEVCVANGFTVDMAYRDTPTPALVYYLTDYLDPNEVAGLINCTASHNPPEWQGIKFNPRLGYPAPTNLTDFIASRINEINLLDQMPMKADLALARQTERLRGFDPIDHYVQWVMSSGKRNRRIEINFDRIREYFGQQLVVIDEMHGASRGYLARILGEMGIRCTVIHAETDPTLPGLDYANPEEPYINALKEKVKETGAILGLGMDTDSDRFGIIDVGGVYYRPNQILPILVRYLGIDRGLTGRVIATQTGSPLIEPLAGKIVGNEEFRPDADVVPAYIDHPFYRFRLGNREERVYRNTFMVPVGIKYIEEQRRTDRRYRNLRTLPDNWRETLLIGGEESSGLTTRGHVTDKDGIWANLLVMDMLAYYGTRAERPLRSLREIWEDTCTLDGCWVSYGGQEARGSNVGRSDVDAILEAKEDLINYYLDSFLSDTAASASLKGLQVIYAGGVHYDIAELQFRDTDGDARHFLRVRSSGTEPLNRIYVESSQPETAQQLMTLALNKLEELISREIREARSEWRLVDVLTVTKLSPQLLAVTRAAIARQKWAAEDVAHKLQIMVDDPEGLEGRTRRMTRLWIEALLSKG